VPLCPKLELQSDSTDYDSHQTIKKDDFYALLSVADLALITPLRDGMNTTSMEYVICQEKTNKAPLILSEFMGISTTMRDALYVSFLIPSSSASFIVLIL